MSLPQIPSRRIVTYALDRDIGNQIKQLAECVVPEYEKQFVSCVMSALLASLIFEDTGEAFDAFTRIVIQCDFTQVSSEIAWGQFTQLAFNFFHRYRYDASLIDELVDIVPADHRDTWEEVFTVSFDHHWTVMRVE